MQRLMLHCTCLYTWPRYQIIIVHCSSQPDHSPMFITTNTFYQDLCTAFCVRRYAMYITSQLKLTLCFCVSTSTLPSFVSLLSYWSFSIELTTCENRVTLYTYIFITNYVYELLDLKNSVVFSFSCISLMSNGFSFFE